MQLSELSHIQTPYNCLVHCNQQASSLPFDFTNQQRCRDYIDPFVMQRINEQASRRLQDDLELIRCFSSLSSVCPTTQLNDLSSQNKELNTKEWIVNNFNETFRNNFDRIDGQLLSSRQNSGIDNSEQLYSSNEDPKQLWSSSTHNTSQQPFTKAGAWVTFNNV